MTGTPVSNKEEQSTTSSTLLRSAKQGQETAWERLVNCYSPRVERWTRAAGLQATDAADVVQEVFIAVAKNIERFRRDRQGDSFRFWLRRITTNKIRDHWRNSQQRNRGAVPLSATSEPAEIEYSEASASSVWLSGRDVWIRHCMEVVQQVQVGVSERDWQIFQMAVIESKSAADVAEFFGVTRNVVYLVKSRILKRIKEELPAAAADRDS